MIDVYASCVSDSATIQDDFDADVNAYDSRVDRETCPEALCKYLGVSPEQAKVLSSLLWLKYETSPTVGMVNWQKIVKEISKANSRCLTATQDLMVGYFHEINMSADSPLDVTEASSRDCFWNLKLNADLDGSGVRDAIPILNELQKRLKQKTLIVGDGSSWHYFEDGKLTLQSGNGQWTLKCEKLSGIEQLQMLYSEMASFCIWPKGEKPESLHGGEVTDEALRQPTIDRDHKVLLPGTKELVPRLRAFSRILQPPKQSTEIEPTERKRLKIQVGATFIVDLAMTGPTNLTIRISGDPTWLWLPYFVRKKLPKAVAPTLCDVQRLAEVNVEHKFDSQGYAASKWKDDDNWLKLYELGGELGGHLATGE